MNTDFKDPTKTNVKITDFIDLVNQSNELNQIFPNWRLFPNRELNAQEDSIEFHRFVLRELSYIPNGNQTIFQSATETQVNNLFFAGAAEISRF